jgi:hypothetical protein
LFSPFPPIKKKKEKKKKKKRKYYNHRNFRKKCEIAGGRVAVLIGYCVVSGIVVLFQKWIWLSPPPPSPPSWASNTEASPGGM